MSIFCLDYILSQVHTEKEKKIQKKKTYENSLEEMILVTLLVSSCELM